MALKWVKPWLLEENEPARIPISFLASQKRDGLGTTHHEAGTLWTGFDPNASVTDFEGRFRHS